MSVNVLLILQETANTLRETHQLWLPWSHRVGRNHRAPEGHWGKEGDLKWADRGQSVTLVCFVTLHIFPLFDMDSLPEQITLTTEQRSNVPDEPQNVTHTYTLYHWPVFITEYIHIYMKKLLQKLLSHLIFKSVFLLTKCLKIQEVKICTCIFSLSPSHCLSPTPPILTFYSLSSLFPSPSLPLRLKPKYLNTLKCT